MLGGILEFAVFIALLNLTYENKVDENMKTINTTIEDIIVNFVVQNDLNRVVCLTDKDDAVRSALRRLSLFQVQGVILLLKPDRNLSTLMDSSLFVTDNHEIVIVWCDVRCEDEVARTIASKLKPSEKRFTWIFVITRTQRVGELLGLSQLSEILSPTSYVFTLVISITGSHVAKWQLNRLWPGRPNSSKLIITKRQHNLNTRMTLKEDAISYPLRGYNFKAGVLHSPPSVVIKNGPTPIITGYNIDVIKLVAEYLGFRYTLEIEKNGYGKRKKGNWTGLVGSVYQKVFDFSGSALAATYDRGTAVDFSPAVYDTHFVAIIRRPTDDSAMANLLVYVEPLALDVWLLYGVAIVVMSTCTHFALKQLWSNEPIPTNEVSDKLSTSTLCWAFMATVLKGAVPKLPEQRSSQTLILILTVLVLLVTSSYNSLLTSKLTIRKGPNIYKDLDELIDEGKYGISVTGSKSVVEVLRNSKDGPLRRIWKKIISQRGSLVKDNDEGLKKVRNEKYVYLTGETNAGPNILNSNCKLTLLKEEYISTTLHFMFPKNFDFTELFSLKILSIRSSGILQKLIQKHYPKLQPGACQPKPIASVPVQQAVGAFAVLAMGIIFSVIYGLVEIIYETCHLYESKLRRISPIKTTE